MIMKVGSLEHFGASAAQGLFWGSAGRSDARSGRTCGTAIGTPLFGALPLATEGFGVISAIVVVPLLLPLPQRCVMIWWYFCIQIEAKKRLQPQRSPHVFMGFVVAFAVALLLFCCCVVVSAPPTVCADLVVFLCINLSKCDTSATTFPQRCEIALLLRCCCVVVAALVASPTV